MNRRRWMMQLAAAGSVVAACGGSDANRDAVDAGVAAETVAEAESSIDSTDPGDDAQRTNAVRRVLPLELRPESDVPDNPLPAVEVHDVGQDRMVNIRNVFPAEKPVLLWMWAPY